MQMMLHKFLKLFLGSLINCNIINGETLQFLFRKDMHSGRASFLEQGHQWNQIQGFSYFWRTFEIDHLHYQCSRQTPN